MAGLIMGSMLLMGCGDTSPTMVLLLDAFTDTNGTALTAHTIGPVNVNGNSYATVVNGLVIENNKAACPAVVLFNNIDVVDVAHANVTLSATVFTGSWGADSYVGFALRATDNNNHWQAILEKDGNDIAIYSTIAGSTTQQAAASFTAAANTSYYLVAQASGATITLTLYSSLGGTQLAQCSYNSATFNQTNTHHGPAISNPNGDQTITLDNFQVTSP